jgi:hypothetical protein
VTKGERLVADAALCALYLRGAPFARCVQRRRWPLVVGALRSSVPSLSSLAASLRAHGLYDEASLLADDAVLQWALGVCSRGESVTFLSSEYPRGWAESLGAASPPCLWVRGALPAAPAVAVVGSRELDPVDRSFAVAVGRLLMRTGRTLVTGGAVGADTVALDAALAAGGSSRCVVVLPCGLERAPLVPGVCHLSVCEPWAEFTTGQAMERNALVYAYGRRAVVVRASLRQGGTWHGAVEALRRRLGAVCVRSGSEASAALCALGAQPVSGVGALAPLLEAPLAEPQPALFGALPVREPASRFGSGWG